MKTEISGSEIKNATIICHEDMVSAAFTSNMTVELYGKEYTVIINVDDKTQAKEIFKHFHIDWSYEERLKEEDNLKIQPDKHMPGVPCDHPGCCSHALHPCEGCGRIACR